MTGKEVQRWADEAMFHAAPMQVERTEDGGIIPQVHLLWMTPDPLGAVAAMARMYEGKPTYNLADITDEDRRKYWDDILRTHLQTPLEAIQLHFFVEGVTRSFTHQMVRQRLASFAQESLRFAVPDEEKWTDRCSLPPSLAGTSHMILNHEYDALTPAMKKKQQLRFTWEAAIYEAELAYRTLVEGGVPAEDARGLIPHSMTTRIHFRTDLKSLAHHAGNRLCTQAQFEWRIVMIGMVNAIRQYPGVKVYHGEFIRGDGSHSDTYVDDPTPGVRWQFETIADSALFRPVCYQQGHCPFNASFDRACSIRGRVEEFAARGVPSSEWEKEDVYPGQGDVGHHAIKPAEWLLDPAAARNTSGGGGHA